MNDTIELVYKELLGVPYRCPISKIIYNESVNGIIEHFKECNYTTKYDLEVANFLEKYKRKNIDV